MIATILLSLLNVGLLAVPIGGTAGVLAGIDYHRKSSGQAPLFTGDGGDGSSSSGGNSTDSGWDGDKPNATTTVGGVTISEYCQQYNTVEVNTTTGQNYTLNPNQWGWVDGEAGGLCLNITTNNNGSYATNTTAPKWSATWQYDEDDVDQPVHAYPNIQISDGLFPVTLDNISVIEIVVDWTYADNGTIVVPEPASNSTISSNSTVKRAVTSVEFNANVAIDMFFDSDPDLSQETSNATYEVMVWFAQIGSYADPIGWSNGTVASKVVENVNFTLYTGTNDKDQHVLTWIAQETTTSFEGSILPLITELSTLNLDHSPVDTDYLGYFSFGSEAYYSNNDTVTFDVPELSINIW